MNILVIDAQGGGIGKLLITAIKRDIPSAHITAVGTNTSATMNMMKAGADEAATGENPVVVACRSADVIVGPVGIAIADSMLGEITPRMALAVAQSQAKRVLIPFNQCRNIVVGIERAGIAALVQAAIYEIQSD